MTQSLTLCGVILAAGKSSRMGTDKALLPWPPAAQPAGSSATQTLLSAAIAALNPVTGKVIVVAGKNAAALAPIVSACGAFLVENPDPDRGQFSSLQTGLSAVVAGGYDAAIITPVDCPPLSAATLRQLCVAFDQALAAGKWAVAPEHQGMHGHPLVAGRQLIHAFLSAPVTSNARAVQHAHLQAIEYVPVSDSLLSADLNTPEQYNAAARARS